MSVGTSGIVSATMKHKMGLLYADIPSAQTADNVITYDGNSYNTSLPEKWNRITAKCTTVTWNASMNFTSSTHKPYKVISDSKLYFISKPSVSTVAISTTAGTQLYAWSASGSNTTIATANQYKQFTVATPDYSNAFNKKVWEFSWTGTGLGRQWVAPATGTYTMECWGANGGLSPTSGSAIALPGIGGYVRGDIDLLLNNILYVFVGSTGNNNVSTLGGTNTGGWNGGGTSSKNAQSPGYEPGSGGGGSTDIRLYINTGTEWNNAASLRTRLIVAGGGGGCGYVKHDENNPEIGGCGGGLIGEPGTSTHANYTGVSKLTPGGTQTESPSSISPNTAGLYRVGGFGYASQKTNTADGYGCGAGGGWYGGVKGWGTGGSGGSSFILGHVGCNPVNPSATTTIHYGTNTKSITYGGRTYTFTNTRMIDGDGYLWDNASITRIYQDYNNPGVPKNGNVTVSRPGVPAKPATTNHGCCRITYTP